MSVYDDLVRMVRIARGLEAGGLYNAAKLFWAAAFSHEIRASGEHGVPMGEELEQEIEARIQALAAAGEGEDLIAALRRGQQAVRENRTIAWSEIPPVRVCRRCGQIVLDPPEGASGPCPACGAPRLTMREFPPIYFLEPLPPAQALGALAAAPAEVEAAIRGLRAEHMERSPGLGEWAVRDVLSHLLVAQRLLAGRVDKMLAEDNPSLEGVAAWAIRVPGELLTGPTILEQFRASRQATVNRLEGLSAADWWRTGQHGEFGPVTILQQASYFAKHDRSHLPQIAEIRQRLNV